MENDSTVNKLLSLIERLLAIAGGFVALVPSVCLFISGQPLFAAIVAVVLIIVVLLVCFARKRSIGDFLLAKLLNLSAPEGMIEILEKEVSYTYTDRETVYFESSFKIKVLHATLSQWDDRVKWTGGPISAIESLCVGQSVSFLEDSPRSHSNIDRQYFRINFQRDYTSHDEPLETGFRIPELKDPDHIARPILLVGIYEKTGPLTLRVDFGKSLTPTNIRKLKYTHFIDQEAYSVEPADLMVDQKTGNRYVVFHIETPIYGGKYVIDWSFAD